MSRPLLLDLFCGAGGAAMGYHRAGFDVIGVDINPQPHYPFKFQHADALTVLKCDLVGMGIRAIHASPPCQGYSLLRHVTQVQYPRLIEPVRELLLTHNLPYVIENVPEAPLRNPIILCGTMFDGLRVLRHRKFESNVKMTAPVHNPDHPLVFTYDTRKVHYGALNQDESFVQVTGGGNCTIANARQAMGIDWMTKAEINEAIPPAYTEYVGERLIGAVGG